MTATMEIWQYRPMVIATEFRLVLARGRSVAAGRRSLNSLPGPCDSRSSQAFCSHPVMIVLSMRSACQVWRLSESCIAAQLRLPVLFIYLDQAAYSIGSLYYLACPAANPAIADRLLCSGLVTRARLLPPLVRGRNLVHETSAGCQPIFMGCLFPYGCLYLRRACLNGNGCLNS